MGWGRRRRRTGDKGEEVMEAEGDLGRARAGARKAMGGMGEQGGRKGKGESGMGRATRRLKWDEWDEEEGDRREGGLGRPSPARASGGNVRPSGAAKATSPRGLARGGEGRWVVYGGPALSLLHPLHL